MVVQSVFGVLINIVISLLINLNAADLAGKIRFIFGVMAVGSLIWSYFRVPET